jgi:hypothetical protein
MGVRVEEAAIRNNFIFIIQFQIRIAASSTPLSNHWLVIPSPASAGRGISLVLPDTIMMSLAQYSLFHQTKNQMEPSSFIPE